MLLSDRGHTEKVLQGRRPLHHPPAPPRPPPAGTPGWPERPTAAERSGRTPTSRGGAPQRAPSDLTTPRHFSSTRQTLFRALRRLPSSRFSGEFRYSDIWVVISLDWWTTVGACCRRDRRFRPPTRLHHDLVRTVAKPRAGGLLRLGAYHALAGVTVTHRCSALVVARALVGH